MLLLFHSSFLFFFVKVIDAQVKLQPKNRTQRRKFESEIFKVFLAFDFRRILKRNKYDFFFFEQNYLKKKKTQSKIN
jgi:hypothetical protein